MASEITVNPTNQQITMAVHNIPEASFCLLTNNSRTGSIQTASQNIGGVMTLNNLENTNIGFLVVHEREC